MEIKKAAVAEGRGMPTAPQLDAINRLAKTALTGEQVYVFSLRLCDDQVDRDLERFDTGALPGLAALFVGKTGIVDHNWSSRSQFARIFETQVIREENCSYIKAWAYIPRGEAHDGIIADIEAGIKKEVSLGCAMGKSVCNICGQEYGQCGHRKGESYDGVTCCAILKDPVDAYEFSFVAVPAQREAGVMKGLHSHRTLKELAQEFGAQGEYQALVKQAQLGKCFQQQLEDQVVRLCLTLELGVEEPVLRSLVKTAGSQELQVLRKALEERLNQWLPGQTQLSGNAGFDEAVESGFLI